MSYSFESPKVFDKLLIPADSKLRKTVTILNPLGEDYSIETAIVVAELYRHNGEWKFAAVGSGFQGVLEALCRNFGLNV